MKLENIINKIKNVALTSVNLKDIALLGGIALSPFLFGCENQPPINPVAPSIFTETYETSGLMFSGDKLTYLVIPREKPFHKVEARTKIPGEDWSDYKTLTNPDEYGIFETEIVPTPVPGTYSEQDRTTTGDRVTENGIVRKIVNMNRDQILTKLEDIFSVLVDTDSTVDGDIIDYWIDQNAFFTNLYNNDSLITIYVEGGGQRDVINDCQWSSTSTYNSEKHADATSSSISYNHIGYFSSTAKLEEKIMELHNSGWPRTF